MMADQLQLIPQAMMPPPSLVMHGPYWHRLHVWTVVSEIIDDGNGGSDSRDISEHLSVITVDPDECDIEDGYDTPVKEAARYIRTKLYIYGPYSCCGSAWFEDEPYVHPYTGEIERVTVHPEGFTVDEENKLRTLVSQPWERQS